MISQLMILALLVTLAAYITKQVWAFCKQLFVLATSQATYSTAAAHTQASRTSSVSSQPGPKSGGGVPRRSAHALILSTYLQLQNSSV